MTIREKICSSHVMSTTYNSISIVASSTLSLNCIIKFGVKCPNHLLPRRHYCRHKAWSLRYRRNWLVTKLRVFIGDSGSIKDDHQIRVRPHPLPRPCSIRVTHMWGDDRAGPRFCAAVDSGGSHPHAVEYKIDHWKCKLAITTNQQ